MTKVGQMFERERISYGNEREQIGIFGEKQSTARKMLAHGDEEGYVMEITGLTQAQIDALLGREEPVLA